MKLTLTQFVTLDGVYQGPGADEGPALGMHVTEHAVTPGGLTILELEATGPATLGAYQGVTSVNR